ncbi:Imm1 family immunity protein [Shimia aestuarii]|uniref:Imm1 family immunity protein n=1 Tax=Shimia aestuarii TaxID=254406 RepID=UPI001FB4473F|nr:Imm1 family immunity protein [Shimia aestuarii]
MHVTINGEQHSLAGVEEAERLLASHGHTDDLEIWVSEGNGSSLCALLNRQYGWLMFLRFEGDAGFSSRNPLREQSEGPKEAFVLSNGQVDNFPSSWTMDRKMVFDALLEFVASGQRPSKVDWHDDT